LANYIEEGEHFGTSAMYCEKNEEKADQGTAIELVSYLK
jgi:hypothetical protein